MRAAPMLRVLVASLAHAQAGLDMDAVLASCPKGKEWLAAEAARRRAQGPPPAIVPARPALREEVLRLSREDQQARAFMVSGATPTPEQIAELTASDRERLVRLRQIVAESGFPRAHEVGHDGVAAAWLLVQHADRDPAFQERMLMELSGRGEGEGIEPVSWPCSPIACCARWASHSGTEPSSAVIRTNRR